MNEYIRDRAIVNLEKRQKKVRNLQVVAVCLGGAALVLYGISQLMPTADRPYMLIPIAIIGLVYAIIHTVMLGLPFIDNEITIEDIDREVGRLYRKYRTNDLENLSDIEILELKELQNLVDETDEYI